MIFDDENSKIELSPHYELIYCLLLFKRNRVEKCFLAIKHKNSAFANMQHSHVIYNSIHIYTNSSIFKHKICSGIILLNNLKKYIVYLKYHPVQIVKY